MSKVTGNYRNLFSIVNKTTAKNSVGQAIPTWSTVGTVWGSLVSNTGTVRVDFDTVSNSSPVTIECRYDPLITMNIKLTLGSRTFYPTDINDVDNRHAKLIILAREDI